MFSGSTSFSRAESSRSCRAFARTAKVREVASHWGGARRRPSWIGHSGPGHIGLRWTASAGDPPSASLRPQRGAPWQIPVRARALQVQTQRIGPAEVPRSRTAHPP